MILLIDNYDSFTFNLYQQIGRMVEDILVVRNDKISIEAIIALKPEAIILSPGPGRPEDAGILVGLIESLHKVVPILGICLGHQAIALAFGGKVAAAKKIMHGKMSVISHEGAGIFEDVPIAPEVMRYHSLAVDQESLPACLKVTASAEDGEIMAIRHTEYPVLGLQFHPESIGTAEGSRLIGNFLAQNGIGKLKGVIG